MRPPPVKAVTVRTAGSFIRMPTISFSLRPISADEIDWSARRPPCSRPESWFGKNPFGMAM